MGVSGVGKTTVAEALARRCGAAFVEADALHPPANVAKLRAGIPLVDDDRWPWLDAVADAMLEARGHGTVVATCSALRRRYRDRLCERVPGLVFVYLEAPPEIVQVRAATRAGHFAAPTLVPSQFAALEPPAADEPALRVDATRPLPELLDHLVAAIAQVAPLPGRASASRGAAFGAVGIDDSLRTKEKAPMSARIVLLPGDGIGPEVLAQARNVLDAIGRRFGHRFTYEEHLIGGVAIDATGSALPDATLEACRSSDAVLLGAVGHPRFDDPSVKVRPEQGLLAIRAGLGVFANLRPVRCHPVMASASPVRADLVAGVDMMVVRELTGGLYFGEPKLRAEKDGRRYAIDTLLYHEHEIERIARLAFELALGRNKRLASVDKANVLESSRLWRQIVTEVAKDYPQVELEHVLVDAAAMHLIRDPRRFDVIVTENMFGDILTDEASVLAGSIGLLPSASIGADGPGLYEPIHGSAPDIAGKGIANPLGTIASVAMLLRYSLRMNDEALAVDAAVDAVLASGARTRDLGGELSTSAMGEAVVAQIERG